MTDIGQDVTKEGPTYHILYYIINLIRAVHSCLYVALAQARSNNDIRIAILLCVKPASPLGGRYDLTSSTAATW